MFLVPVQTSVPLTTKGVLRGEKGFKGKYLSPNMFLIIQQYVTGCFRLKPFDFNIMWVPPFEYAHPE